MVKIGHQTEPYEDPPVHFEQPEQMILPFEVHYETLLDLFKKYTTTLPGPWRLSRRILCYLHVKHNLPGEITEEDVHPIWTKMIDELCPTQLTIPSDFKVEDRISDVDDNTNIIFATGIGPFLGENTRMLRLSNPAVAMLLRLAS